MYRTTVPGIFRDQEHEIYRFDDSNDFKYDELEDHMLSKFALWQGHVSLSGRIERSLLTMPWLVLRIGGARPNQDLRHPMKMLKSWQRGAASLISILFKVLVSR